MSDESQLVDVLNNVSEKSINCLDKGFARIVDVMPRLVPEKEGTADHAIVQMARVSYGEGTKTVNEDRGLIRYLMRHNHSSPIEAIEFKFHLRMPIFCARQIVRHRTCSMNEESARYSVMKDDFYLPEVDNIRPQAKVNKQAGEGVLDNLTGSQFLNHLDETCINAYALYEDYLAKGVCREQARMILPVNLYTQFYWKQNLHNLLHFLALRCDSHAQYEVRVIAEAMLKLITPIVPFTVEAWNDYHPLRGAVKFSKLEMDALRTIINDSHGGPVGLNTINKGERLEWNEKLEMLGFGPNAIEVK